MGQPTKVKLITCKYFTDEAAIININPFRIGLEYTWPDTWTSFYGKMCVKQNQMG